MMFPNSAGLIAHVTGLPNCQGRTTGLPKWAGVGSQSTMFPGKLGSLSASKLGGRTRGVPCMNDIPVKFRSVRFRPRGTMPSFLPAYLVSELMVRGDEID